MFARIATRSERRSFETHAGPVRSLDRAFCYQDWIGCKAPFGPSLFRDSRTVEGPLSCLSGLSLALAPQLVPKAPWAVEFLRLAAGSSSAPREGHWSIAFSREASRRLDLLDWAFAPIRCYAARALKRGIGSSGPSAAGTRHEYSGTPSMTSSCALFLGVAGPLPSGFGFCASNTRFVAMNEGSSSAALVRVRNRCIGRSGASTSPCCHLCLDSMSLDLVALWCADDLCPYMLHFLGVAGPWLFRVLPCQTGFAFLHILVLWNWTSCTPRTAMATTLVRVRNRCIGRSGASTSPCCSGLDLYVAAVAGPYRCAQPEGEYLPHLADVGFDPMLRLMENLGLWLVPLARSLLLLFFLALLRLLLFPLFALGSPFCCCRTTLQAVPIGLSTPLGHAAGMSAILPWEPERCGRRRYKPRVSRHSSGLTWGIRGFLCGILSLLSPNSLPALLPSTFPVACWVLLPTQAYGMARAEEPEDRAAGPPPPLPMITSLAPYTGSADVAIPWADPDRPAEASSHICSRPLPWPEDEAAAAKGQRLGCYVYTPHYAPVAISVDMPGAADLQSALDCTLAYAPGVPEGLFDGVVPIRPQRFPGYLQVIRFPTVLRHVQDGYAAVICNLTHVGGPYFPTVLPRSLSHAEVIAFLQPLTSASEEPLRFFVGCRNHLWPPEANVILRDGDAITCFFGNSASPVRYRAEDLEDRNNWGPLQHFFEPEVRSRTCVMYRESRYCIAPYHHTGQHLHEYLVHFLQLDPRRVAACEFGLQDLDVQGDKCATLLAVADVAPPTGGFHEPARQDLFVLCDLRPLGLKPRFMYTHVPRLYLPSLTADLGIALPSGFVLGVLGARVSGNTVRIDGNCTLLLYARPAEDTSSQSSSPCAVPMETDDADPASVIDASIPEGHNWNAGHGQGTWSTTADNTHPAWDDSVGLFVNLDDIEVDSFPPSALQVLPVHSVRTASATEQEAPSGPTSFEPARPAAFDEPEASLDTAAQAVVAETAEQDDSMEVVALIYAPDLSPEMVATNVPMPCAVDQAVSAVAGARRAEASCGFKRLTPVTPQPCLEFLVLVVSPDWLTARPMVLIDCLRLNRTLFAKVLFPYANRETILLAAGLRHDSPAEVFVHGLLQPLQPGQRIQLVTGMVISLAPAGCGAPATFDLATRLLSREGWDPDAMLPGPDYTPGMHFWVLTDGQPTLFSVGAGRRQHVREDLALQLQAREPFLHIKATQPSIVDAFFNGHLTSAVWIATERVSRVPWPPARARDEQVILVLDCRHILLGIRWLLLPEPIVPTQDITGPFQEHCPDEYVVAIAGAEAIQWGNEYVFQFESGQVITVSFDSDISSSEGGSDSHDDPPDLGPGDFGRNAPVPHDDRTAASRHAQSSARNRSRSPRPGAAHSTAGTGELEAVATAIAATPVDQGHMWRNTHSHDAVADGRSSPTPVPLTSLPVAELAVWICWLARSLFADKCWADCFGRRLFQFLREESAQSPAGPVPAEVAPEAPNDDDIWALTALPFVLLAPDFQDEHVTLHMVLPQSVTEAIDLLDTSRGRAGFELFPHLCTVHPLPRIDAVAVIMLPPWLEEHVIVCLDVTQCGGGAFAAVSDAVTDRYAMLNLAGFAAASDVQIFPPHADEPVEAEGVIRVSNGDCVRFLPPNASLRPLHVLSELLTASGAANFEPRTRPEVTDRYCLVGDGFYCAFELYPERARFYRADIASRMGFQAQDLLLSQARPRIQDALMYGKPCRTVVATGASSESMLILQGTIGLLDCRPILEGWRRLLAPGGWVDLRQLRERFSRGAPANYEVCFSGCEAHWQWLWLEPGQVIQVTYQSRVSVLEGVGSSSPASLLPTNSPELVRQSFSPTGRASSGPNSAQIPRSNERGSGHTSHPPGYGHDMCMWATGSMLDVCLPDILWLTTVAMLCRLGRCVLWASLARVSRWVWRHTTLMLVCFLFTEHLSALGVEAVQICVPEPMPTGPPREVQAAFGVLSVSDTACPEAVRRHIPTPCRARRASVVNILDDVPAQHEDLSAPAPSVEEDFLQGLHTLLEDAGGEPDCPAFFLAATLLDTLFEHFAPACRGFEHGHTANAPRILSLESLVVYGAEQPGADCHVEMFDLTARQCALPCTPEMLQVLTSPLDFAFLSAPEGQLSRPERFREWLAQGQPGRSPAPGEVLVLTADGSFDPALDVGGWAVVASLVSDADFRLPGQFAGCIAGSTRELQQALEDAYPHNSAYLSEVAGLFWAALLALRLPGFAPLVFRADNIGALQGVSGKAHLKDHSLCRAAGAVHTALRIRRGHSSYQHVLGHAADAANELADALAGRASAQHRSFSLPGLDLRFWFQSKRGSFDWLPHLCLQGSVPASLPAQRMDVMSWSCATAPLAVPHDALLRPFLRAVDGAGPPPTINKSHHLECCIVSFNVLSLLEHQPNSHAAGMHGETGRVKLLCSTFEALGVSLAGLQECRTPKGDMHCQTFHRFASGKDEHSCYGVELWIADKGPFDHRSVTVLHAEPTFMLVGLAFLGRPLRILVAHGPHRVHPEAFRAAWWARVHKICMAHHRNAPFIVLSDANCRLGSNVDSSIGPHQADAEDFSGSLFRSLLVDLGCWLPSTFASTAQGPGGTLYQRRSREWVRSDYAAIPQEWSLKRCVAWVEPSISAGHQCLDHLAVAVSCCLLSPVQVRPGAKARRIDVDAMSHPENRHVVDHILSTAPQVSWDVDASEHVAALVDHVYRGLAAHFPQARRPMRGTHFSDLTQRLHGSVAALRHSIRTRDEAYRKAMLRCVLLAWSETGPSFSSVFAGRWLWLLQIRRALDCMLLRRFGRALRTSCRHDRRMQLEILSEQVSEAPCPELHKAVRKIMRPKKFRRAGTAPLPMLYKPDGSVCESQDEITRVWRDHFRVIEAGKEVIPTDLAEACLQRQAAFEGTDTVDAGLVPTWAQLQNAFKATSPHKACGPDLLPPAICTLFSQRLTEVFWPVMLKAVLRSNEALGLKGGLMHRIAKPSAVANTTAGYRGILVQSCLSKVLHRAVRHMAVEHWGRHMLPLQIGGRKGCPASFGHFCSRAFLHMAKAQGRSAAVLFVDIAAAYYGVIREAILGSCASGRPLEDLVASLGLSQEDLQHLTLLVETEPVLREQGAADLFAEVANELHRNTWFVLSGDSQLIETHRGTRPGGSLADVIFSILFSKVLQRRSGCVEAVYATGPMEWGPDTLAGSGCSFLPLLPCGSQ